MAQLEIPKHNSISVELVVNSIDIPDLIKL